MLYPCSAAVLLRPQWPSLDHTADHWLYRKLKGPRITGLHFPQYQSSFVGQEQINNSL